jgi:uncharacterized protein (DUF1501 family)
MTHHAYPSRRAWLKGLTSGAALTAASPWLGPLSALAQTAPAATGPNDYKALVCLFMFGGNDGNNLVVPTDAAAHALYAKSRRNLTLQREQLLPLQLTNTAGAAYGLHPSMSAMQGLINAGQAAVVANVGPLVVPTTQAQWQARSVPLPMALFSHSDQQAQWQSAVYQTPPRSGWAGRAMERLLAATPAANAGFATLSLAGGNLWQAGDQGLVPYKVAPSGRFGFDFYEPKPSDVMSQAISGMLASPAATNAASDMHPMHRTWLQTMSRSLDVQRVLTQALEASALTTVFPNSGLGRQLGTTARLIGARSALGLSRQVFFVSIGGFDTHGDDQMQRQQELLGEISEAVGAFQTALTAQGTSQNVTLFTASDFGRTMPSNGQGSDHGWGNNHLVVGGAVNGARMVGRFPDLTVGGPDDTDTGRWIPSLATDQLSAELATWFGAGSQVADVVPGVANFDRNLGLMRV